MQSTVVPQTYDETSQADAWLSFSVDGGPFLYSIVSLTGFGGDTCANYPSSGPLYFSSIYADDQNGNPINLNFQENGQQLWGKCGDSMSFTDGSYGTATFSYNPWSVSISSSNSYSPIGGSVTLTANSDIDVGETPYYLEIVNAGTGSIIASCWTGVSCTTTVSQTYGGGENYYAEVSDYGGASPIEQKSPSISVTWFYLEFSGSISVPVGDTVTLTATTNINLQPTPYVILIKNSANNEILEQCGNGYSCSYSITGNSPTSMSFYAQITYLGGSPVYLTSQTATVTWYTPSGGDGGGCVLAGTLIVLSNGTQVQVQNVTPGMSVLSYDTNSGQLVSTIVSSNQAIITSSILDINHGELYASGPSDQRIFVMFSNGTTSWIPIQSLAQGMKIYKPISNTWISVHSLRWISGSFTVYDLITNNQSANNYIANGILMDVKIG